MQPLQEGATIEEMRVTPDKYLPYRYAGASGDFNPIHIDREMATQANFPGIILHGLYGMALVARAVLGCAGDDPRRLRRLSVDFRAVAVPEHEIAVTGSIREMRDGVATVDAVARQRGKRIIRSAEAELDVS